MKRNSINTISSTGVNSLFIDIAALDVYAIRNRKTNTQNKRNIRNISNIFLISFAAMVVSGKE